MKVVSLFGEDTEIEISNSKVFCRVPQQKESGGMSPCCTKPRPVQRKKFSSKGIYPEYGIGDDKHKANMEHMAGEVRKCLVNTQYGGSPCVAMRGIGGQENFVFNDEEHLVSFLGKNENRKTDNILQYHPIKNDLWREVATVWDLDEDYTGGYREGYQIL